MDPTHNQTILDTYRPFKKRKTIASTVLHKEILNIVLGLFGAGSVATLSLVCREWKEITETHLFWHHKFLQAGWPLPLNPLKNLKELFGCKEGPFFSGKIRNCKKPQKERIKVDIDFTYCKKVFFIDDDYVVSQTENRIDIAKISNLSFGFISSDIQKDCLVNDGSFAPKEIAPAIFEEKSPSVTRQEFEYQGNKLENSG